MISSLYVKQKIQWENAMHFTIIYIIFKLIHFNCSSFTKLANSDLINLILDLLMVKS